MFFNDMQEAQVAMTKYLGRYFLRLQQNYCHPPENVHDHGLGPDF
jgi:hypothetical protein